MRLAMLTQASQSSGGAVTYSQGGGRLQLSGLTLAPAAAGQALKATLTATNVTTPLAEIFEWFDQTFELGGVVTDQSGLVAAIFADQRVSIGPNGTAIRQYDSGYVYLTTAQPLPVDTAGTQVTVWVGEASLLGAVSIGVAYGGSADFLSAAVSVPAAGTGGGGGNPPPPTQTGGSQPKLSTVEIAGLAAGGLLLLGGSVWAATRR